MLRTVLEAIYYLVLLVKISRWSTDHDQPKRATPGPHELLHSAAVCFVHRLLLLLWRAAAVVAGSPSYLPRIVRVLLSKKPNRLLSRESLRRWVWRSKSRQLRRAPARSLLQPRQWPLALSPLSPLSLLSLLSLSLASLALSRSLSLSLALSRFSRSLSLLSLLSVLSPLSLSLALPKTRTLPAANHAPTSPIRRLVGNLLSQAKRSRRKAVEWPRVWGLFPNRLPAIQTSISFYERSTSSSSSSAAEPATAAATSHQWYG